MGLATPTRVQARLGLISDADVEVCLTPKRTKFIRRILGQRNASAKSIWWPSQGMAWNGLWSAITIQIVPK